MAVPRVASQLHYAKSTPHPMLVFGELKSKGYSVGTGQSVSLLPQTRPAEELEAKCHFDCPSRGTFVNVDVV